MATTLIGFLLMVSETKMDPVLPVDSLSDLLIVINCVCFSYLIGAIGYVLYQAISAKRTQKILISKQNSNVQVVPMTAVIGASIIGASITSAPPETTNDGVRNWLGDDDDKKRSFFEDKIDDIVDTLG